MRWNPVEQIQDIANKFGTEERIRRFQSGELVLVERSKVNRRWIKIDENTIAVDLESSPRLPFAGAEVEQHIGVGGAILQKRADGLYRNDRKVVFRLSERQKGSKVAKGYELRDELIGKPVLNANELDALYDNPHLLPEDWKKDEKGNIRFVFLLGTIYCSLDGRLCARCIYFDGRSWNLDYRWLGRVWNGDDSAAVAS